MPVGGSNKLDTHTDTCTLGRNFIKLYDTMQTVSIIPYTPKYEAVHDIPVVTAATAVQLQSSGETIILVINQGLWFGDTLDNSLINPNQLWHHGTVVADNHFDPKGIYIGADGERIPLVAKGTTLYFDSKTPTQHELGMCRHIHLMSEHNWDPHSVVFPHAQGEGGDQSQFDILGVSQFATLADILVLDDVPGHCTFTLKERTSDISPASLSKRWQIGIKQAAHTLKVTTQKGVRLAVMPMMQRYRADRMFLPNRLHCQRFYTDTMFLSTNCWMVILALKYSLMICSLRQFTQWNPSHWLERH